METITIYITTTPIRNSDHKFIRFHTEEKTLCENTDYNWHFNNGGIEMVTDVLHALWATDQKFELVFDDEAVYREYLREEITVLKAVGKLYREHGKLMHNWMEYAQAYILMQTNSFKYIRNYV